MRIDEWKLAGSVAPNDGRLTISSFIIRSGDVLYRVRRQYPRCTGIARNPACRRAYPDDHGHAQAVLAEILRWQRTRMGAATSGCGTNAWWPVQGEFGGRRTRQDRSGRRCAGRGDRRRYRFHRAQHRLYGRFAAGADRRRQIDHQGNRVLRRYSAREARRAFVWSGDCAQRRPLLRPRPPSGDRNRGLSPSRHPARRPRFLGCSTRSRFTI